MRNGFTLKSSNSALNVMSGMLRKSRKAAEMQQKRMVQDLHRWSTVNSQPLAQWDTLFSTKEMHSVK